MALRFISEAQSAGLITHEAAFIAAREALLAAFQDGSSSFPVVFGHGSSRSDRFTVKAAATADLTGVKIGSYWPGNLDQGLPRHHSLILLFDQTTGRIDVAVEGGVVNAYRTSAADAVAADLLAAPDASTLAIFGAGRQARYEVAAVSRVRPIRHVLVVGRDPGRAAAFASALQGDGFSAQTASAEVACTAAQIIITATAARAPLFDAGWVSPGAHIASMGSDAPGKQELPPELFARAALFCDLPDQARRIGELQHAAPDRPVTAIGEVIAGSHIGRRSDEEITIFDSSGLSLQDLYVARYILEALPDPEAG